MSALAIQQQQQQLAADPVAPRDEPNHPGFHDELHRASTKQAAPKPKTIQPRRDRGPKPDAARAQPQAQSATRANDAPNDAPKPTAIDDVIAMISAGKSLVGAVAPGVVAPQVADDEAPVDDAAALETTAVVAQADAGEQLPMTPLEQAVHDLIDRLRDGSDKAPSQASDGESPLPGLTMTAVSVGDHDAPAKQVSAPPAVREPTPAEQAANPSHVHLVIDDGERLVVTVAVRGDQVIAHVRGDNEQTVASLARNAGVLDEAMRARGLDLAELQTGHDSSQPRERNPQQSAQRERAQPRFSLEETP